jgi:hypothetical protein
MLSPAISSEYAFGTKVLPSELDVGRPLFNTLAGTTVGYWDIGTPGYDESDPVYLHIARFFDMIAANDVRLTSMANRSPGSKVTSQDLDMNKPLTLLPVTINYLNIHDSMAYDLEDPVYLHQYYCGRDCMGTGLVQVSDTDSHGHPDEEMIVAIEDEFKEQIPYRGGISVPRTSCIEFTDGYKMLVTDYVIDYIPQVAGVWRGLIVEKVHGVKADYYHVLNTWYAKIDPFKAPRFLDDVAHKHDAEYAHETSLICTNDVRLNTSDTNMDAGTKVLNFDVDQNKMLSSPAFARFLGRESDTTRVRYFDANGNGIYDYSDDVYLNYPSGTAIGVVTVNNIRLSGPVNASPI